MNWEQVWQQVEPEVGKLNTASWEMCKRCVKCLFYLLPICNKRKVQPNQTPNKPKAPQTEQMEQFPWLLSVWSQFYFGSSLADEEWWDFPFWKGPVPTRAGTWVPKKGLLFKCPTNSLSLGKSRLGRGLELSVAALPEELLLLFFKEPPWNVFMLWEKQASNLPELLAPFQEGIVLCVNSSWGRCVEITALGRMGGKEIPFSLQSRAPFFC